MNMKGIQDSSSAEKKNIYISGIESPAQTKFGSAKVCSQKRKGEEKEKIDKVQAYQHVKAAAVARNNLLSTPMRVQTEDHGFKYSQGKLGEDRQ